MRARAAWPVRNSAADNMPANASENAKYFMLEEIRLDSKYTKLTDVPCGKAVPLNCSTDLLQRPAMKLCLYYMRGPKRMARTARGCEMRASVVHTGVA